MAGGAVNMPNHEVEKHVNGIRDIIIKLNLDPALLDTNDYRIMMQRFIKMRNQYKQRRSSAAHHFILALYKLGLWSDLNNTKYQTMRKTFLFRVDNGKY